MARPSSLKNDAFFVSEYLRAGLRSWLLHGLRAGTTENGAKVRTFAITRRLDAMDRIDFALRRYRQLVPQAVALHLDLPVSQLERWLTEDVAGLVGEYAHRPLFREAAAWSIRALRPKAETPQRRQLDGIVERFQAQACTLGTILKSKRLRKQIGDDPERAPRIESIDVGHGMALPPQGYRIPKRVVLGIQSFDQLACAIARPFWTDLVDVCEYMEPRQDWQIREPAQRPARHSVDVRPDMPPLGDFVLRGMLARLDALNGLMQSAGRRIGAAQRTLGPPTAKRIADLKASLAELDGEIVRFRTACRPDGLGSLRESCVVLTQVYAAFHAAPNIEWLGLGESDTEYRMLIRRRLTAQRGPEMADRVALAVEHLRHLFQSETPWQSALDESVAQGGLVLEDAAQRNVFWEGVRIEVDWTRHWRPWQLLVALTTKATRGAVVEEKDLYTLRASGSAMANLKSRLSNLLPASLRRLIVPSRISQRSYSLVLPVERICIFRSPG